MGPRSPTPSQQVPPWVGRGYLEGWGCPESCRERKAPRGCWAWLGGGRVQEQQETHSPLKPCNPPIPFPALGSQPTTLVIS